jgi:maleate cis-trans isomerase
MEMSDQLSVGFLYPGLRASDGAVLHQAEDDFPLAEDLLETEVSLAVARTRVEEDAHRKDALLRTGAVEYLLEGASQLRTQEVQSAVWACTSGSFVLGLEGATEQARTVADYLGVPASSTSLAFVEASRHLGIRRVAIAGSYPADVVDLFVRFLTDAGLEVVSAMHAGIITGVGVGEQESSWTFDLVKRANRPEAEAVLVPDTAMHTMAILDDLDAAAGKPVLTANQVSIWHGLALAGIRVKQGRMGALFAA